jgi:hypothetical protein
MAFRNIADQFLHAFNRLKITAKWALATHDLLSFGRGRALAKRLMATPPPPNFIDAASVNAPFLCSIGYRTEWLVVH